MPSSMSHWTPSVMSCCMAPVPHSPLPALRNVLPKPLEPRKFTLKTAYPRFASHWWSPSYPNRSRDHGPPCTSITVGRLPDAPTGVVR